MLQKTASHPGKEEKIPTCPKRSSGTVPLKRRRASMIQNEHTGKLAASSCANSIYTQISILQEMHILHIIVKTAKNKRIEKGMHQAS